MNAESPVGQANQLVIGIWRHAAGHSESETVILKPKTSPVGANIESSHQCPEMLAGLWVEPAQGQNTADAGIGTETERRFLIGLNCDWTVKADLEIGARVLGRWCELSG
jgi:hypothetical protein